MTAADILAAFPKMSVLVIGDICLDRWCTYEPDTSEPSRETGIPRIGVVLTETTPGAGGTVANNLVALGAGKVAVMGVVGDDGFGYELVHALRQRGISSDLLVRAAGMQTFTYTKLINARTGEEDLPRLDFISTQPLNPTIERLILDQLPLTVDNFDVILIADQAETSAGGVITTAVRELLADLAPNYPDKIFWVDSRARIELFRNVILKPNRQEAEFACQRIGAASHQALLECCRSKLMIVTDGPGGALVVLPGDEIRVPVTPIEHPVDICGAGDSFSAAAAMVLAVTRSPVEAARFGNLAASITIMKKGTGTASPAEVLEAARA
ncbi:MAG: ribokinase [Acidobacteria bacterium]|nr:MAG: ribokinase [Acidobacteriota bacterium]